MCERYLRLYCARDLTTVEYKEKAIQELKEAFAQWCKRHDEIVESPQSQAANSDEEN